VPLVDFHLTGSVSYLELAGCYQTADLLRRQVHEFRYFLQCNMVREWRGHSFVPQVIGGKVSLIQSSNGVSGPWLWRTTRHKRGLVSRWRW